MTQTHRNVCVERVRLPIWAPQVEGSYPLIQFGILVQDVHDPGSGVIAEVPECNGRGHIDGGEQPEQDDGEEAADGEEDEHTTGVDHSAHKQKQAKQGKYACRNEK